MTDVKTFPIPFTLKTIEDNIYFSTNSPPKTSKEEIISQAFKFHSEGNILEAARYYQDFLDQGFSDHIVFSNYGVILKNLGKLQEAELSYRKAIEMKPDFAEAHSNLGNILRNLGKLQDAELTTRKAIKLNPEYAKAHSNLGNILRDLGKSQEAFDCYLKVTELDPNFPNIYQYITRFLGDSNPSLLNQSKLKNILNQLLERNDINHQELFKAFYYLYNNKIINNLDRLQSDFFKTETFKLFINDKLIINVLRKIIFCDFKWESLLTKTRKSICEKAIANKEEFSNSQLQFIIALGEQCFLNEYVYSLTKEEKIYVDTLIKRCIAVEINESLISILSCYLPLYKLLKRIPKLKYFYSTNQNFKELIKLQILEPIEENKLSQNIKRLGSINNVISQQVKSQYEENPYPRWRYGNNSKDIKLSLSQLISSEIEPNSIYDSKDYKQLKILIAGCGTGNQILQAQRYKNAQITGIDLSLSSLSYAQRKINELGINNVQLVQMDILEVSLLNTKFDIIECSGVLHHMKEANRGLDCLLDCLDHNGFLKLALYSRIAIKDVIAAAKHISSRNLEPTLENIHLFREEVFSGKYPGNKDFVNFNDFYSSSEVRDFFFHYQAQYFDLIQLEEILRQRSLKFLGFLQSQSVKSLYKKYFPEDKKQTNLTNWIRFEERHAVTFREMYQFWVCKTNKS